MATDVNNYKQGNGAKQTCKFNVTDIYTNKNYMLKYITNFVIINLQLFVVPSCRLNDLKKSRCHFSFRCS